MILLEVLKEDSKSHDSKENKCWVTVIHTHSRYVLYLKISEEKVEREVNGNEWREEQRCKTHELKSSSQSITVHGQRRHIRV